MASDLRARRERIAPRHPVAPPSRLDLTSPAPTDPPATRPPASPSSPRPTSAQKRQAAVPLTTEPKGEMQQVLVYLTADQRAWLRDVRRNSTVEPEISASEIVRYALEELRQRHTAAAVSEAIGKLPLRGGGPGIGRPRRV